MSPDDVRYLIGTLGGLAMTAVWLWLERRR